MENDTDGDSMAFVQHFKRQLLHVLQVDEHTDGLWIQSEAWKRYKNTTFK